MIDGKLIKFLRHSSKRWKKSIKKYSLKTFLLNQSIEIGFGFMKTRADDKQIFWRIEKIKQNEWKKKGGLVQSKEY